MKIYNIKLNHFIIPAVILLTILAVALCSFLQNVNTIKMTSENFTEILKNCHDAPYEYENKRIEMVGYIFRANDFNANQFVIARDMLINESESRIVGFLCDSPKADELKNNEWIHATGTIHVGDYHGAMPIVKILKFERCTVPRQIWVFPPKD